MHVDVWDGDASRPLIADLNAAVYPPEILSSMVWRSVTSARSSRRVLVRDGDEVVATAGMLWREACLDGAPILVAGLGGVMTHPSRQSMGLGRIAVQAAMKAFTTHFSPAFGLLFCEEKNVAFYSRLGWTRFQGAVFVDQPSGRILYDLMQPMVVAIGEQAPLEGDLDLNGLPW